MKPRNAILAILFATSATAWAQAYAEDYRSARFSGGTDERVDNAQVERYAVYQPPQGRTSADANAGAIIGGIAGALIGSQLIQGNGNGAAVAVGAIAGAVLGNQIQHQGDRDDGYYTHRVSYPAPQYGSDHRVSYRTTYEHVERNWSINRNDGRWSGQR